MAAVDENMAGATLTSVMTENATSVTVDDDRFEIAGDNLKLKDGMSLDFEGDDGGSIDVTITASGDGESATHTVTVTINDVQEAPTISVRDGEEVPQKGVTSSLTIDENATGADIPPLALIYVTDPDAADATTGQAGADLVSLSGGMEDYFEVKLDPENGLWLALKSGASFNFEEHGGSVMVTVTYTDTGGHAASQTVTVTINDVNEAPDVDADVDVGDMTFVGAEETSMEVDLKALFMDPDGDLLTYRLSDNAPDWLEMSVTVKGTGDAQTITGTISGTPPADSNDMTLDGVMIIASDGDGMEAHASFDIIVDAENDAPTRLELRVTEDDGFVVRTTEVNVDENDSGAVLGSVFLRDPDDARHPHGMHTYTFMVDGEADTRFEVDMDGNLRLKADASLDREEDGREIDLTVTATDMAEGDAAESISLTITIMIGNVDTGNQGSEGPSVVKDDEGNEVKVGPVTITVDEDLDEDDVDAGDWLKTVPSGLSTAFEDPDGDTLTYSLGSGAPRWLVIDEDTGELTNAELMLPRRGVYDVTIVASDDDGNTSSIEIEIAVALSDPNDEDNDEPDIRNIDEIGYTEGDKDGPVVATFEVRDDDIEIAPHPFGVHEVTFTAKQDPGDGSAPIDVTHAFKIEPAGDDGRDTAEYEIRAKTPAELAMGADRDGDKKIDVYKTGEKKGEVIPVDPIDYEEGDEIDFEITVTDSVEGAGQGEDDRSLSIDVENAPDEQPAFQGIDGATRKAMDMESTVKVDQDQARKVWVLQLEELWQDADTDDEDLSFKVGGTDGLPDWIKVYGPDQWEDIYENRRTDVEEEDGDDVTGLRDRDEVVVIVVDRSKAPTNTSRDGASFTITADDGDNDPVTETIMFSITDTNVDPADETKVVSISGGDPNDDDEVTGTGNLTMNVNLDLDPDIAGGQHPYLVLYTWMVPSGDPDDTNTPNVDESVEVHSVSVSPQPLPLGVAGTAPGTMVRNEDYLDGTITAKVEVFERDPATGGIIAAQSYMAEVDVASAEDGPVTPPPATSVTFGDITTDATGLVVTITATGGARSADGRARLEASNDGTSGWITVDSVAAETEDTGEPVGTAPVTLDVNADGDDSEGDGGGLYYRVVYLYEDEDGDEMQESSPVIQLGTNRATGSEDDALADPDNIGLLPAEGYASGVTVRVNNLDANVEAQWQVGEDVDESGTIEADEWKDLDGETALSLTLTDDHAGNSVRARLTHKADEDNPSHVTWVDYSAVAPVTALPTTPNNTPTRTKETHEIRVNPDMNEGTEGTATGNVASLFFDADGDSLTYSLVGDLATTNVQPGRMVYRSDNDDQILTLNSKTGAITYYTNNAMAHDDIADDTDSDGGGNWLVVTVEASDGKPDTADDASDDVTINVRVNVAPTAIDLDGTDLGEDAASAISSNVSFAETDDYQGTDSFALNVQDLNEATDPFGMHDVEVDDKRFEVEANEAGTTWTVTVKAGSEFDFEDDAAANQTGGVITLKVTATDKGGKKVEGYITVTLTDVGGDNESTTDPQGPSSDAGGGGVMTAGTDAGAGDDDDGAGDPPGDGGLWVEEDLLNDFVISIEDFDVA